MVNAVDMAKRALVKLLKELAVLYSLAVGVTRDLRDGKPALGKMAYKARVKAFLKTRKAQNAAKRQWRSMRSVARIVIRKKGAASGK